ASQAVHVLDRFHLMMHFSKAVDEIRAEEPRQLKQDGYEPLLKHSRWCLLKRPTNLTHKQTVKLTELVKYNLRSVRAYLLKEDFQRFWGYVSAGWAVRFLDEWCGRTMRSRLEPMKRVARMLRAHRTLILNWFHARGKISAGIVEGFNNKAKLTTKKAYGFRTYAAIELALYHQLENLPEPTFAHSFWRQGKNMGLTGGGSADGVIYFGDDKGRLYARSIEDGSEVWTHEHGARIADQ